MQRFVLPRLSRECSKLQFSGHGRAAYRLPDRHDSEAMAGVAQRPRLTAQPRIDWTDLCPLTVALVFVLYCRRCERVTGSSHVHLRTPMPFAPQRLQWPGRDAILLVHGIGDDSPGESAASIALKQALGTSASSFAIYDLRYDTINDWFAEKTRAAAGIVWLRDQIRSGFGGDDLGDTVANVAGDVVWPILSTSARSALVQAFTSQLLAMALDGPNVLLQRISIICHSMGCYHTYEALHTITNNALLHLRPSDGFRIQNVVFMASPVQLIRTVSGKIGSLVPDRNLLALSSALAQPVQGFQGNLRPIVRGRWVSITGNLDPVGGHLLRDKLPWAYMDVPGQESFIDRQFETDIQSREQLRLLLTSSFTSGSVPKVTPQNPHDWSSYINRHATDLESWLVV